MQLLPEVLDYVALAKQLGFDTSKFSAAVTAFVDKYDEHLTKYEVKVAAWLAKNEDRAAKKKPLDPLPKPEFTRPATKALADKMTNAHQALSKSVYKEYGELSLQVERRYARTRNRKPCLGPRPIRPALSGSRLEQIAEMREWLRLEEMKDV